MKYLIERVDHGGNWVKSQNYTREYSYAQAQAIIDNSDGSVEYRMVPDKRTSQAMAARSVTRNVTREEFLDTLVDEAKERISFDIIQKYLPFAIVKRAGNTYNHIVNDSVYPIQTEKRTVREGETLCGRRGYLYAGDEPTYDACPGCLAIARGIAVRDLV